MDEKEYEENPSLSQPNAKQVGKTAWSWRHGAAYSVALVKFHLKVQTRELKRRTWNLWAHYFDPGEENGRLPVYSSSEHINNKVRGPAAVYLNDEYNPGDVPALLQGLNYEVHNDSSDPGSIMFYLVEQLSEATMGKLQSSVCSEVGGRLASIWKMQKTKSPQ